MGLGTNIKKTSFTLGNGMICPYCKEKQYVAASSRKQSSVLIMFISIPFLINIFFDLSISTSVIFTFIVALIIIGVNPFLIKLSNEEEPLF